MLQKFEKQISKNKKKKTQKTHKGTKLRSEMFFFSDLVKKQVNLIVLFFLNAGICLKRFLPHILNFALVYKYEATQYT